jgi:hypothetical protein
MVVDDDNPKKSKKAKEKTVEDNKPNKAKKERRSDLGTKEQQRLPMQQTVVADPGTTFVEPSLSSSMRAQLLIHP